MNHMIDQIIDFARFSNQDQVESECVKFEINEVFSYIQQLLQK